MPYTNNFKLSNGSKITVNNVEFADALSIELPADSVALVDITTLGSTRREYTPSDMPDADEIKFQAAYSGTNLPAIAVAGGSPVACSIMLSKVTKTWSFSAFVTSATVIDVAVDGKLTLEVTLKPTTAVTVS